MVGLETAVVWIQQWEVLVSLDLDLLSREYFDEQISRKWRWWLEIHRCTRSECLLKTLTFALR